MKILHVYKDYFPVIGGIENHLRLLARRLAGQPNMEVTVLTTSLTRRTIVEEDAGVRVIKAARAATIASTPISLDLFRHIGGLDVDIAHLHFPYPVGEIAYLLRGRSRKLVVTYHSDIIRQRRLLKLYSPFLWRILDSADQIIATSPNYIQTSPYLSKYADKCTIIPLGVDLSLFAQADQAAVAAMREQYRSPILSFVGRFRYYKGLQYLIEAMKRIDATLLLSGAGPEESKLRRQVETSGLQGKVIFLGELPDEQLPVLYRASQIYVLPACERSEALGVTQMEAMISGVPVVCTEIGTGTTYVNVHGETGLVVPPRDPGTLAEGVSRLLSDEEYRSRLGHNARERARRGFGADLMVKRVIALYQELLQ